MTVTLHWRARHVTPVRLRALREVLEARPGPEPFVVALTGTGDRVLLPQRVDPTGPGFRRDVHAATGGCAVGPAPGDAW